MEKIEELEKHIAKLEKKTRKMEKQLSIVMNALCSSAQTEQPFDAAALDKIISDSGILKKKNGSANAN